VIDLDAFKAVNDRCLERADKRLYAAKERRARERATMQALPTPSGGAR
jgi:hypothetical protein